MGLPEILAAIRAEAAAEVAATEGAARRQAEEALERARADAARIEEETAAELEAALRSEADDLVDGAGRDAAQAERSTHGEWLEALSARVEAALEGARAQAHYPAALEALLLEAWAACPDAREVRVDPRDADLARAVVTEHGLMARLEPSLRTWGGVAVASEDGRVVVDDTLEQRWRRAEPALRVAAGAALAAAVSRPP